jgi:hypothetical protein
MTTSQLVHFLGICLALTVVTTLSCFGAISLLHQFENWWQEPDPHAEEFLAYLEADQQVAELRAAGRDAVLERLLRDPP